MPVLSAQAAEMLAQVGALDAPPADADVDVVALRKHPAVAAGTMPSSSATARCSAGVDLRVRQVALERDADGLVAAQARAPRADRR